jgi:hypothetical protein
MDHVSPKKDTHSLILNCAVTCSGSRVCSRATSGAWLESGFGVGSSMSRSEYQSSGVASECGVVLEKRVIVEKSHVQGYTGCKMLIGWARIAPSDGSWPCCLYGWLFYSLGVSGVYHEEGAINVECMLEAFCVEHLAQSMVQHLRSRR